MPPITQTLNILDLYSGLSFQFDDIADLKIVVNIIHHKKKLMKTLTKTLLATSTGLLALGSFNLPTQAAILIGNSPSTTNDRINAGTIIGGTVTARAYSFTTGAQAYDLNSIDLRLSFAATGSKTPLVTINSNSLSTPGGVLASLTTTGSGLGIGTGTGGNPSTGASYATYNYTSSSLFTFAANTTYWLRVATVSGTGTNIFWSGNNSGVTPSGIATPGNYLQRTSGGWGAVAYPSAQKNSFQINATQAVPEPLTILGAATAAGFGGLFKRRLAKSKKQ